MGKIKPTGFAAHFDVKPLIPAPKAKFSRPPKKKKFRLKLRFNQSSNSKSEHKVKTEKKSNDFWSKPNNMSSFFNVKPESDFYIKKERQVILPKLPKRPQPQMHKDFFGSVLFAPPKPKSYFPEFDSVEEYDCGDPTYLPNSDEFCVGSSEDDDSGYFEPSPSEPEDVLRIKPVNTRKLKVKKEKKIKKTKKPRRRYKRRVLSDSEKLQASRRRRTCLVKKPKSQYLGVSWCNTKNTWVARVWHPTERKLIWAGYHQNERACALAVNEKCLDLKIPLKNPHIMGH